MIKEILPAEVYEEITTHLYNRANADWSQEKLRILDAPQVITRKRYAGVAK